MKKIIILLLVLAVFGGSVFAIDGQMGVISNVTNGSAGLGFTWKNGIANDSVLNLNVGGLGSDVLSVNGAYHFTFIDAPIAGIDWFYWNVEAGPYAGVTLGSEVGVRVGVEAAIGLSFYLAPLFDANIPLELFIQGGPYLGVAFPSADDNPIDFYSFATAAGIRWVF